MNFKHSHEAVLLLGQLPGWKTQLHHTWSVNATTHVVNAAKGKGGSNNRFVLLNGAAIYEGRLFDSSEQFHQLWKQTAGVKAAAIDWSRKSRGPSSVILADKEEETVAIASDPLGSAIIYYLTDAAFTLVSTDLGSLVELASDLGISLTKSLNYLAVRTLMGNGGLIPSPYEEIKTVPFGHIALVRDTSVQFVSSGVLEDDLADKSSYIDLAMEAVGELRENISVVSNAPASYRIAQLTGGFDSRLVLAGLIHEDRQHDFLYYTSGAPGLIDRDIADDLIRHYGLVRSSSSGQAEVLIEDVVDRLHAGLYASAGVAAEGPTGYEEPSDVTILGGVYGANIRAMYPKLSQVWSEGERRSEVLAEAMWGGGTMDEGGMFSSEFRHTLLELFKKSLVEIEDMGFPADTVGDAHMLLYRNRYYNGQFVFRWNQFQLRHDPIYSRAVLKLSRSLPLEARRLNVAGFDILRHLEAPLTEIPYDYPRYTGNFKDYRRKPRSISINSSQPVPVTEVAVPKLNVPSRRSTDVAPMERQTAMRLAKKLQAAFWQVYYLPVAQEVLRNALNSIHTQQIDVVFNRSYLDKLANSRLTNRVEIRRVYLIVGNLSWFIAKP